MENPTPFEPVTIDNLENEIGIIHDFFQAKLAGSNNLPLIEDDELPIKQRFPKPRLPPTGKILSPRKRPLREQQQMAKKKRKLEEGREESIKGPFGPGGKVSGKLRLDVPTEVVVGEPGKADEAETVGMMSPESM